VNRLAALVVVILVPLPGAMAPARADPPAATPPATPASSFAPHHTAKRAFGSPIEPQILHSRKRKPAAHRTAPAASRSHTTARQP
jgi:hypothetical protein